MSRKGQSSDKRRDERKETPETVIHHAISFLFPGSVFRTFVTVSGRIAKITPDPGPPARRPGANVKISIMKLEFFQ
jgi:hypothetical protein